MISWERLAKLQFDARISSASEERDLQNYYRLGIRHGIKLHFSGVRKKKETKNELEQSRLKEFKAVVVTWVWFNSKFVKVLSPKCADETNERRAEAEGPRKLLKV